jgi:hypothetical protein
MTFDISTFLVLAETLIPLLQKNPQGGMLFLGLIAMFLLIK